LGVTLTVLTVRLRETGIQKTLFMLTGVSAAAIPVCAILHNFVYGPLAVRFGKEFWGPGGDEPVFFVLAIFVCPALFLIGTAGSGFLFLKARFTGNKTLQWLHSSLGNHLGMIFKVWLGSESLMESCRVKSGRQDIPTDDAARIIVDALWERLQETYRLRAVK
jgi:Ni/Fe-hydrogenase subunit HybB-like protein